MYGQWMCMYNFIFPAGFVKVSTEKHGDCIYTAMDITALTEDMIFIIMMIIIHSLFAQCLDKMIS
jgi:hypothetical protein